MTRFFEQHKKICEARGISLNGAAKEIGLPSSSVTHWKDGATSVVLCIVISKIKAATRV